MKTRSTATRLLAILLVAVMALGALPFTALAATAITDVSAYGVQAPVPGNSADWTMPTISPYADYEINGFAWVESDYPVTGYLDFYSPETGWKDDITWYYSDDADSITFKEGMYYTFCLWLDPKTGFEFADPETVTATINDTEAGFCKCETDASYTLYRVYSPDLLLEVHISDVTPPRLTETASYSFSVTDVDKFASAEMFWAEMDTPSESPDEVDAVLAAKNWAQDELTFKENKEYVAVFKLCLKDDYTFDTENSEGFLDTANDSRWLYPVFADDRCVYLYNIYDPQTAVVEELTIGDILPIIGETAPYSFYSSIHDITDVAKLYWVETGSTPLSLEDIDIDIALEIKNYEQDEFTFKEGMHYTAVIDFSLMSPYRFASELYVNSDYSASASPDDSVPYSRRIYYYVGTPLKLFSAADVTVNFPVVDRAASYDVNTSIDLDAVEALDLFWAEMDYNPASYPDADEPLNNKGWAKDEFTFKADKKYTAVINLDLYEAGYTFNEATTFTVNGVEPTFVDFMDYQDVYLYYDFDTPARPLDYVEAYVYAPAIGAKASYDLQVSNSNLMRRTKLFWVEMDTAPTSFEQVDAVLREKSWAQDTFTFKEGKRYVAVVELTSDCCFEDPLSAYINESSIHFMDYEDINYTADRVYLYYDFGTPRQSISSATVTDITAPAVGETTSYSYDVAETDIFYDDELYWAEMNTAPKTYKEVEHAIGAVGWNTDGFTFKEGKHYVALIDLMYDREVYAPDLEGDFTINGFTPTFIDVSHFTTGSRLTLCYDFGELVAPIDMVEITGITAPVIGKTVSYDYNVTDAENFTGGILCWAELDAAPESFEDVDPVLDNKGWVQDDFTFKEGKYYVAVIELYSYKVFSNSLTATFNGLEPTFMNIRNKSDDENIAWLYYDFGKLVTTINSVAITGITAPVIGETASYDFDVTDADKFEYKIFYWAEMDTAPESIVGLDNFILIQDEKPATFTFKEGKHYIAAIVLQTTSAFAEPLNVTINGKKPTLLENEASLIVVYDFGTALEKAIPATEVKLSKTAVRLAVGETETLIATVLPENATDQKVTFTSSDKSIVTVDAAGKLTAVKNGTATITATVGDKTATCTVTVTDEAVMLGDGNGDGNVNMKDVLALRKRLAGLAVEIDLVAIDVNVDGNVNMKDVLALRKFLAGLITSFTTAVPG